MTRVAGSHAPSAPWSNATKQAGSAIHLQQKQGKNMTNTIELLETIGRDASLRHASTDVLSHALDGLNASDALKQAAVSGDDAPLTRELGHREIKTPNHPNNNVGAGHEDDMDDELESGVQSEQDGSDKDAE